MEEMYNSKTAAMNLVHELCKLRTRGNLDTFMELCVSVMNEFQARRGYSEPQLRSFRRVCRECLQ